MNPQPIPIPIPQLAPGEFVKELKATPGAVLIDVRTPQEYAQGHLAGAENADWLNPAAFDAATAGLDKDKPYFLYCRSGHRSYEAAEKMHSEGFGRIYDMAGGILRYEADGLPVVK